RENTKPSTFSCEVCSAPFETRRGLSSHARSHLRQLGVGVSESSGAPIDLLYQITKERATDAQPPVTPLSCAPAPSPKKTPPSPVPTPSPRRDADFEEESQDIKPPLPLSVLGSVVKVPPSPTSPSPCGSLPSSPFGTSRSPSPSPVLRKAPISSLLPVSSPLRSQEHKSMCRVQSAALSTPPRPFWAPQDTDAPLNLTDPNKDIICKLCGAWFETRKGLSSHARAHLRHFGVEYSESKGSPIDLLNRLILTDDFKHRANSLLSDTPEDLRVRSSRVTPPSPSTSTSSASKRPLFPSSLLFKTSALGSDIGPKATSSSSSSATHSLLAPPTKKLKPSTQHVFRLNSRELMPISLELLYKTVSSCFAFVAEPMKDVGCEFCGELFENRKGLSSHARSHLRQLGITEWSVNGSPIDTLRELIARRGLPCVMPLSASASATSSSSTVVMVKPKPEPKQVEVTMTEEEVEGREAIELLAYSLASLLPPVMPQEREPSRDIRCEFCGEFFENRKGLSSHARSHLRHMGITEWSVNGSPIDTLWEIMRKQGTMPASVVLGVKEEPGQDSSPSWNSQDASCELCGFFFENRKALASHARAHLRQFGVTEWCVNGSPIETLSAWMRSRPQTVAEIHRSYLQGGRSAQKKVLKTWASLTLSHGRTVRRDAMKTSWRSSSQAVDVKNGLGASSRHVVSTQGEGHQSNSTLPRAQVARSELNVRVPRGIERRPLKHPSHADGGERESCPPKPPRTSTVPALVPKPPSTPLVKLVGKIYSLKCRFCDVEFHGPLSVQEDWIRHLQQHILNLNYNKPSSAGSQNPPCLT
uniref:C2H2-type domain-containing protein n=1 Tax=Pygocentrus nattereri TaxID=42514 RepID=A0A3B4BSX3_PYGNA